MGAVARNGGRRASMADVGSLAEVSAQTVSRYFNGGYVSSDARERIERAVRVLGYRPNRLPRSLRATRTDSIGFLAFGPVNYGYAGVLTGVNRAALAEGQTLLTTLIDLDPAGGAHKDDMTRALDRFLSMRIDALIVASPYTGLETVLELVDDAVPVVSLNERDTRPGGSFHTDSYGAARIAVQHLLDRGHRRILHVAGPEGRIESAERLRAYDDTLREAGVAPLPLVHSAEWDAPSGARAAEEVRPAEFSAVFAANDEIALGFMSAMRRRGYVAPSDFSIVGIDDMPEAQFLTPPLTSARIDFEQLGENALRLALAHVAGEADLRSGVAEATLSVRESTAPHREH